MWNRRFISVFCLLAVAVQPVLAANRPCCCVVRTADASTCCPQPARVPHKVRHSCCAQQATCSHLAVSTCSCDISRSQPVYPRQTPPRLEPPTVAVMLDGWETPPSITTPDRQLADSTVSPLCGPPLLALYCRWLN